MIELFGWFWGGVTIPLVFGWVFGGAIGLFWKKYPLLRWALFAVPGTLFAIYSGLQSEPAPQFYHIVAAILGWPVAAWILFDEAQFVAKHYTD